LLSVGSPIIYQLIPGYYSHWFDPNKKETHNLVHSKQVAEVLKRNTDHSYLKKIFIAKIQQKADLFY
jgi:hypothetical protein